MVLTLTQDGDGMPVTVTDDAYPDISACFEFIDGHLHAVALRSSGAFTISAVRDLPLARWKCAASAMITLGVADTSATVEAMVTAKCGPEPDATAGQRRHRASIRKLATAAAEYRELLQMGRHDPATEMARRHGVTPGTARSWVYRARSVGLLAPALPWTAGEDIESGAPKEQA